MTDETKETKKTLVQQYEEMVKTLAVNTEKIAPADRTGNGRYAAAYDRLKSRVRAGAGEYAFCYVFGTLYVPNTPEGLNMLVEGMQRIRQSGKELLQAIFTFDFEKIHAVVEKLRNEIFNELWLPLETRLLNSGTMLEAEPIFVNSILMA